MFPVFVAVSTVLALGSSTEADIKWQQSLMENHEAKIAEQKFSRGDFEAHLGTITAADDGFYHPRWEYGSCFTPEDPVHGGWYRFKCDDKGDTCNFRCYNGILEEWDEWDERECNSAFAIEWDFNGTAWFGDIWGPGPEETSQKNILPSEVLFTACVSEISPGKPDISLGSCWWNNGTNMECGIIGQSCNITYRDCVTGLVSVFIAECGEALLIHWAWDWAQQAWILTVIAV